MKTYLVGGAVRDRLLGRPVTERDWVVVGATEAEMLQLGYKKVGRDFPVFLHPVTREEYALARTERKTGTGYIQFTCDAAPTVTLEDDLRRRDLTINAIAQTPNGQLIDPYNGIRDIERKILRHVSPAFVEDPVRILRVARFAATFGDFTVHPSTKRLMRKIVAKNELAALVPERVWQEFERALSERSPEQFFITLRGCGALAELFPALAKKFLLVQQLLRRDVPQCYGTKTALIRFALIASCIKEEKLMIFCHYYHVPRTFSDLARLVVQYKRSYQKNFALLATRKAMTAKERARLSQEILSLLEAIDAFRRPYRLQQFLLVCSILMRDDAVPHVANDDSYDDNYLMRAYHATKDIATEPLIAAGIKGEALKLAIRKLRCLRVTSSASFGSEFQR